MGPYAECYLHRIQGKRIFAAPVEEKQKCTIQKNNRGWSGMNYETLDPKNQRVSIWSAFTNTGRLILSRLAILKSEMQHLIPEPASGLVTLTRSSVGHSTLVTSITEKPSNQFQRALLHMRVKLAHFVR